MRLTPLLLVSLLATAPRALAQEDAPATRPERLYLNSGVLLGSTRMVGLGGAYVGIAEGAEGFVGNFAALAHRNPRLERDWDLDATLSWLDVPLADSRRKDLDNDGLPDNAPKTLQFLASLSLQYKRFGTGFFLNTRRITYCATVACGEGETLQASMTRTALAGAVAFGKDDLLVGVGIHLAEAVFSQSGEDWRYSGRGFAIDVLYRPHDRPYRLGVAVRPAITGRWKAAEGQAPVLGGRQLYSAVVAPGVVSLGASYRLGEGAERYNRLSPAARRQSLDPGEEAPPELSPDAAAGRWLLTAQLDVVGGMEGGAVPVRAFVSQTESLPVGESTTLQPRLGVEHETLPGRLRTRLGVFAEPSPFRDTAPRPHATGGFELFLFHSFEDWALSASFDVARRYSHFGLSVGFWR
ncbi:hypothetical protein P2318_31235 [Myxococcaceae bacterium GXIMD 01537]